MSRTLNYTIVEAPSSLGLRTNGVERLPARLLDLGLADRIGARNAGHLSAPPKDPVRDPETGVLNAATIAAWSPDLADSIELILEKGDFPVVLGGDCTILLGPMLALRRRGRYGLLFIDGHADFFQPEAEPDGEGASMELAWITGYGPSRLTDIEGRAPIVRAEDVVAFGYRDHEDQEQSGSQKPPSTLKALDLPAIQRLGIETATRMAIGHLTRSDIDGFFIHLDADVLDDSIMPAVGFRIPGGLSAGELEAVLRAAFRSGKAVGLEVTIYDPTLDADGSAGRRLADVLVSAMLSQR
jgi:arginase